MSAQPGGGANPTGAQAAGSSGSGPAPAVQTIPIPDPDNITSSELANAESAFPKPAIYTISIIGGLVGLIVLYKLYKWAWAKHACRRSMIAAQAVRTSYPAGQAEDGRAGMQEVGAGLIHSSSKARNCGRLSSYNSLGEFGGTATTNPTPSFVFPGSATQNSTRSSMLYSEAGSGTPGILTPSPTTSSPFLPGTGTNTGNNRPAHPYSTGTPHFIGSRGDSSMSTDVLRAKGSRAFLLAGGPVAQQQSRRDRRTTLPHSYSGHSSDGGSGVSQQPYSSTEMLVPHSLAAQQQQQQQGSLSNATSRQSLLAAPTAGRRPRISGPPHARRSRIEIVTPAPLGPPPGAIVAVDKATLAFSALSGIGASETVMGLSDFVPPSAGEDAATAAVGVLANAEAGMAGPRRPGTSASSSTSNSGGYSGDSRPSTAAGHVHPQQQQQPQRGSVPAPTHSRAFSAATSSSAAQFSDESASLSSSSSPSPFGPAGGGGGSSSGSSPVYEAVPPLPSQYASGGAGTRIGKTDKQHQQGPQSPLDKLKLQLEGEARRVGSQYSQ